MDKSDKTERMYPMKKLLLALMVCTIIFSGCTLKKTTEEIATDFEEFENIEIEVSDFVDEQENQENTQTDIPSSVDTENDDIKNDNPIVRDEPVSTNTDSTVESKPQKPVSDTTKKTDKTATPTESEKKPQPITPPTTDEVDISGKIICIDAGHGTFTDNISEPMAPDCDIMKAGYAKGTSGEFSTEDTVTLAVANKLKEKLEALGVTVLMTRTTDEATMSNKQRAEYANDNNADFTIKLHADTTLEGGKGMTMVIPTNKYIKDDNMVSESKRLAKAVIKYASYQTKAENRGVYTSSQMAGFNWSKAPVVLFEMGFMTNKTDEENLNNAQYQDKIVLGILQGILEFCKQ